MQTRSPRCLIRSRIFKPVRHGRVLSSSICTFSAFSSSALLSVSTAFFLKIKEKLCKTTPIYRSLFVKKSSNKVVQCKVNYPWMSRTLTLKLVYSYYQQTKFTFALAFAFFIISSSYRF